MSSKILDFDNFPEPISDSSASRPTSTTVSKTYIPQTPENERVEHGDEDDADRNRQLQSKHQQPHQQQLRNEQSPQQQQQPEIGRKDREIPNFEIAEIDAGRQYQHHHQSYRNNGMQYTTFVRTCMLLFFGFYLIFALLIVFTGHPNLRNKEHLLSTVIGLNHAEITTERMFALNALFLTSAAWVGIFSFYARKYSLFVSFSVGLLFSLIFAMVSFNYSYSAYQQMNGFLNHNSTVSTIFDDHMPHYNWTHMQANRSTAFVNDFQNEYDCCGGSSGFRGWIPLKPAAFGTGVFPVSCCRPSFDHSLAIEWCRFPDVEKKPSCPTAFIEHLISVQNMFRTQMILLAEICVTEILTVSVFFFFILGGAKKLFGDVM